MSDQFKDRILDLLGISFNIKASEFKDPEARKQASAHAGIKSANEDKNEVPANVIKNIISKEIDYEIQNSGNNEKDINKRKKEINEKEDSIKSLSIYDILKHSSGNKIEKGFYKANHNDYVKRLGELEGKGISFASEEFEKCKKATSKDGSDWGNNIIKAWVAYGKGMSNEWYEDKNQKMTKVNEIDTNKPLKYENGDVLFLSTAGRYLKGPSKLFENALFKIFGGQLNIGSNDALFDGSDGKEISVKAYSEEEINRGINIRLDQLTKLQKGRKLRIELYSYKSYRYTGEKPELKNCSLYKLERKPRIGTSEYPVKFSECEGKFYKIKTSCILSNSGEVYEPELKSNINGKTENQLRNDLNSSDKNKREKAEKYFKDKNNAVNYDEGK